MRVNISQSTFIQSIRQKVYVNGFLRSNIFCTDISYSQGSGGSAANFQCPAIDWDDKEPLSGAVVRVEACLENQNFAPVFYGYITSPVGDARNRVANFSAESPIVSMFDLVYIGDGCNPITQYAHYPIYAYKNGILRPTRWLASEILRDFITSRSQKSWRGGGGTLPSQYLSILKFGGMNLLNYEIGEVEFDGITLKSALDDVVSKVGNVGYREVPTYNGIKIEFYQLTGRSSSKSVRSIRVAKQGESASNSNVAEISSEYSAVDVKTRVIACGDRVQRVLSILWNPWAEDDPNGLQKTWLTELEPIILADTEQSKEPYQEGKDSDELTDDDLLEDRETAQPDEPDDEDEEDGESEKSSSKSLAAASDPEEPEEPKEPEENSPLKHVFTRFKLPPVIMQNINFITGEIPIEIKKKKCKPVAIKWVRTLIWSDEQAGCITNYEAPAVPVPIGDYDIDYKTGYITISEPSICINSQRAVDGKTQTVYETCPVSITMCFACERLMYDTGQPTSESRWYPLGKHGLVSRIDNENFQKITLGDTLYPSSYLYNGDKLTIASAPATYRDDSKFLKRLADKILDESNDERRTYNITLPYFDNSFRIGDLIELQGVYDWGYGTHTITSIQHDLTQDHRTTISTDNSAPLVNSNIFDSWGDDNDG